MLKYGFRDVEAKNDIYIEKMLKDPRFVIKPNGSILVKVGRVYKKIGGFDSYGYRVFTPRWNDGRKVKISLHRVIYAKYNGPLDSRMVVDHIDGNRSNNRPDNLRLVSWEENRRHRAA